eukprot:scaffold36683_cov57-Phaeocystis_antarctica.AAC.3
MRPLSLYIYSEPPGRGVKAEASEGQERPHRLSAQLEMMPSSRLSCKPSDSPALDVIPISWLASATAGVAGEEDGSRRNSRCRRLELWRSLGSWSVALRQRHGLHRTRRRRVAWQLGLRRLWRRWRRGALGGGRRGGRRVGARVESRDGQGRLFGSGEAAEVHHLAGTHTLGPVAGAVHRDSLVADRIAAWLEPEPFCRRLRHRLLGREWRSLRVSHTRLRLGRPCIGQGRLLGGGEAAEVHSLAGALHECLERHLGPVSAVFLAHATVARRIGVRRLQRQPLGRRLAHGRLGCVCPTHRFSCERRRLPKLVLAVLLLAVLLLFQLGGLASRPATPARRHQQRRIKPLRRSPQPPTRGGRERRRRPCLGLRRADVLSQHSLLLVAIVVVDGQRAVLVDVLDNAWEPVNSGAAPKAGVHALADVEPHRGLGLRVKLGGWRLLRRRGALGGGRARRGGRRVGARVESRDGQGRLLGGDEIAKVHKLAGAHHLGLVARILCRVADSLVAGITAACLQLEPFCRCLRHRLSGRERCRLGFGRLRLRLGRPRISQGRLLCGGEAAEVHLLAGALHGSLERPELALAVLAHAAVPRTVARRLQRQPLGLRLAHCRLGCVCLSHHLVLIVLILVLVLVLVLILLLLFTLCILCVLFVGLDHLDHLDIDAIFRVGAHGRLLL